MKIKQTYTLAVSLLLAVTLAGATMDSIEPAVKPKKDPGFLVLELFTSEGCSSCPRADELLAKVQQQVGEKPVYILAYHIDYWDHQGWRDIFSNADYTRRQYEYAGRLNGQVYTPQVVVNGKTEFVGSDQAALANVLKNGPKDFVNDDFKLSGKQQGNSMAINYQVIETTSNTELSIAVVQKHASRYIKRGENGGRTLSHTQIVREFTSYKLSRSGTGNISVSLPDGFSKSEWEIIGLVQDKKTGEIYAANRVSF